MTEGISRRRLAKGAMWAAPAVTLATAAPAAAASTTNCVQWNPWTITYEHIHHDGLEGFLGTVSFWTVVRPGVRPKNGCAQPNHMSDVTTTVNVRRAVTADPQFIRTVTLHQDDMRKSITNVVKTVDPADVMPLFAGELDYQWKITYNPASVAAMTDSRFYTTLHPGDGLSWQGRVTHFLEIDGIQRQLRHPVSSRMSDRF